MDVMRNTFGGMHPDDMAFHPRFEIRVTETEKDKFANHVWITIPVDQLCEKCHDLDCGDEKAEEYKRRFRPYYEQFLKTKSNDAIGYPLAKLFENDPAKVRMYAAKDIYTVEQLVAAPEGNLVGLGIDVHADKRRAKELLQCMKESAAIEPVITQINALELRLQAEQKEKAELIARLERLEASENKVEPRRGPGRPKKEDSE